MATITTNTTNRAQAHAQHQRPERRSETLARMYAKAIAENVQIARVAGTPDTYAALSTGDRGAYIVRPGVREAGCTCQGYQRHQYCKHYALALVKHGLFNPEQPDPTPPAAPAAAKPSHIQRDNAAWKAQRSRPQLDPATERCYECNVDFYEPLQYGMCPECFREVMQQAERDNGWELEFETQREMIDAYDDQDEWINAA